MLCNYIFKSCDSSAYFGNGIYFTFVNISRRANFLTRSGAPSLWLLLHRKTTTQNFSSLVLLIMFQLVRNPRSFADFPIMALDKLQNPSFFSFFILAGTIIDNKVCHPRNNDFYLCAHAGMIVCINLLYFDF